MLGGHGANLFDDVQFTPDGTQWLTSSSRLNLAFDSVAVGQLGDLVVRTCGSGCAATESSRDLETWSLASLPGGGRTRAAVVGFQGRLLVLGGGPTAVIASNDGTSWTQIGQLPESPTMTSAVQFTPRP